MPYWTSSYRKLLSSLSCLVLFWDFQEFKIVKGRGHFLVPLTFTQIKTLYINAPKPSFLLASGNKPGNKGTF